MTRKQIEQLIKSHTAHRENALRNLRAVLAIEARGQETRWARLLIIHTAMIEALKKEKPSD